MYVTSAIRILVRVVAVLALAMAALLTTSSSPASAAIVTGQSGWYGGVTPWQAVGQMVYLNNNGYQSAERGLSVWGPTVTRSNGSSGHQTVGLNMFVDRWNPALGRWEKLVADNYGGSMNFLPAGQSSVKFADRLIQTGPGTFRVRYLITWLDSASGRALGWKVHRCRAG